MGSLTLCLPPPPQESYTAEQLQPQYARALERRADALCAIADYASASLVLLQLGQLR